MLDNLLNLVGESDPVYQSQFKKVGNAKNTTFFLNSRSTEDKV